MPVVGRVPGGAPLTAIADLESALPLPEGSDVDFGLRVEGDSMIEAGTFDGDLVLVKQTGSAKKGDLVVALVGESEEMEARQALTTRARGRSAAPCSAPMIGGSSPPSTASTTATVPPRCGWGKRCAWVAVGGSSRRGDSEALRRPEEWGLDNMAEAMQQGKSHFPPEFVELIKRWRAESEPITDEEWQECKAFVEMIRQAGIKQGQEGAAKNDMDAVQQGLLYTAQAEWSLKTRRHPDLMPVEEARREVERTLEWAVDPLGACRDLHSSVATEAIDKQLAAYTQAVEESVQVGDFDSLPELVPIASRLSLAKEQGLEYEEVEASAVSTLAKPKLESLVRQAALNTKKGPVARERFLNSFSEAKELLLRKTSGGDPELERGEVVPLVERYCRLVWAARMNREPEHMSIILLESQVSRLAGVACVQPAMFRQGLRADTSMDSKNPGKVGCLVFLAMAALPVGLAACT